MSASVRGIGVAVMWRRCGRSSLAASRSALRDAEAVLLVDDGDGEVAEVDLLLDQRVRPDDDLGIARRDELPGGGVLLGPERAREQRHAYAERRAELVDREEVLLGEGLGRRHERALAAGLDRAQERVESATTVFPEPTSPCSRRCIGIERSRSASISAIARSWSGVSVNGSDAR